MSNTVEWQKRQENHRYSQDDRVLAYKFTKELDPGVGLFLEDPTRKRLVVGVYNVVTEPWRLLAISSFRKFGLKLRMGAPDPLKPNEKQVVLIKTRR